MTDTQQIYSFLNDTGSGSSSDANGRACHEGKGQAVSTVDDIHRRLSQEAPCTPLRVSILRKNKTVEVNIIAGEI